MMTFGLKREDTFADEFRWLVSKHFLHGGVREVYMPLVIEQNDCIRCCLPKQPITYFTFSQRLLGLSFAFSISPRS